LDILNTNTILSPTLNPSDIHHPHAQNTRKIRANPLMPQGKKRNHAFSGENRNKKAQLLALLAKSCASLF